MRFIPEPIIRICDVVLKGLVVLPLTAFVLYGLSGIRTLRQLIEIAGSEEFWVVLLLLFTIGYGAWSALAVYARRRKAEHSLILAMAAFVIWVIGIPGFANGLRRSAESRGRSNLHLVRSALSRYQGDTKRFPASLEALTADGYLAGMPETKLPNYHDDTSRVALGKTPDDSAGWLYDPAQGKVFVNCTHTDSKGTAWTGF